jgi:hypothetical protein
MEEIPVEYNIIIEALSCAVQNEQQTEASEGQTNFEFVVINNASDDQVQVQAEGQSTLQCIEQSQDQHADVEAQVTIENSENTSATTNDAADVSTEEQDQSQDTETTQAAEAIQPSIQPSKKTHKCDVCNKAFIYAGRKVTCVRSHYFYNKGS